MSSYHIRDGGSRVDHTDEEREEIENAEGQEEVEQEQSVEADAELERQRQRELEILYGKKLGKLKEKVDRWRVNEARDAFHIGDLWANLEQDMPRSSVAAFLSAECQIPRRDVTRFANLVRVLGEKRDVLIEHGVAVSVMLDLAQQNDMVREEAFKMIRSHRSLQATELNGLKRDIALAEAARAGQPDPQRASALKAAAAKKARCAVTDWFTKLEDLINQLIELTADEHEYDNSPEAIQRVEAIGKGADGLLAELKSLATPELLANSEPAYQPGINRGGWARVERALQRIAQRDLFAEENWNWPNGDPLWIDQTIIWDLAWASGHDENTDPRILANTLRAHGRVPLQTFIEAGRVHAEAHQRPVVLEICAGAGGQAIGLHAAGFRHAALVEVNEDAAATIEANQPDWTVIQKDIRAVDLDMYKGVDLLAGGVPCQPFSSSGERLAQDDERDLFPDTLKLIRKLKPKAIMLENVTGLLHAPNSLYRLKILSDLSRSGYDAEWRIVKGVDFGLCQKRQRAILVGFKRGIMHRFRWPQALKATAPTVGEALRDLMGANGWPGVEAWVKKANGYAPTLIGGSQKKRGIDLAQENSRKSWTKIGVNPSGKANSVPGPDTPVDHLPKLTLRMMARIQDFPDNWHFCGSELQQFHQIANAFPPRMARAVGYSIIRALSGSEVDLEPALATPPHQKKGLNLGALVERRKKAA